MLGTLSEKMQRFVSTFSSKKTLNEENIAEAVSEVRMALLEADVNYTVVKSFIKKVKEKAMGEEVIKAVSPGQKFIKLVHDELISLMGSQEEPILLKGNPSVLLLTGLQGSGKTTTAAKLAKYLKKKGIVKNPLLVACDLQRPAARDQLIQLGAQIGVEVFADFNTSDPLIVAKQALEKAVKGHYDLLIVDTAGRLHIDEELMEELKKIKDFFNPAEILFVANAATGQDAVNVAKAFSEKIAFTGTVLTMLDGSARGGAAISIREITGQPLKFEGIGEKLDDIQPFNPASMADRILGMGDSINLVRRMEEHIDKKQAEQLEHKLRTASFTFKDYLSQLQSVKKMGSLKSLFSMIPGMSMLKDLDIDEKEFFKVESIIQSMTEKERNEGIELNPSRRKRIAKGSGTKIEDVNKLIKSFERTKQIFKNMPNEKQLAKMMGGSLWR